MEFAKTFIGTHCVRLQALYAVLTPAEIKIVESAAK